MLHNLQGAGFIMGSKVSNFNFCSCYFSNYCDHVMLSQRFALCLNLVMREYECGKHNINKYYYLKETFIWGNLRCSANGEKNTR